MTRPNIEAIRARSEAATAGPWFSERHGAVTALVAGHRRQIACVQGDAVMHSDPTTDVIQLQKANADVIAHGRTDIIELISYIEYLESRLAGTGLDADIIELTRQLNEVSDQRDELVQDLKSCQSSLEQALEDRKSALAERNWASARYEESASDSTEVLKRRIESQTDWYQQRFNALRKWVNDEVRPLSEDVAHRYYSIVANGSPAPHESSDWQNTMHGLKLRAEFAEKQLSKMTEERDRALQRQDEILKMADYNAEHMEKHMVSIVKEREDLRSERDRFKHELYEVDSDYLISEKQMMKALVDEFQRGVEKMRDEAIDAIVHLSNEDGLGLGSHRLESAIASIEVTPNIVTEVRVKSS